MSKTSAQDTRDLVMTQYSFEPPGFLFLLVSIVVLSSVVYYLSNMATVKLQAKAAKKEIEVT